MALTTGATLVMAGEHQHEGAYVQQLLVSQNVTHATLPPTIVATLQENSTLSLTDLIVAGEACPAELVTRWCQGQRE